MLKFEGNHRDFERYISGRMSEFDSDIFEAQLSFDVELRNSFTEYIEKESGIDKRGISEILNLYILGYLSSRETKILFLLPKYDRKYEHQLIEELSRFSKLWALNDKTAYFEHAIADELTPEQRRAFNLLLSISKNFRENFSIYKKLVGGIRLKYASQNSELGKAFKETSESELKDIVDGTGENISPLDAMVAAYVTVKPEDGITVDLKESSDTAYYNPIESAYMGFVCNDMSSNETYDVPFLDVPEIPKEDLSLDMEIPDLPPMPKAMHNSYSALPPESDFSESDFLRDESMSCCKMFQPIDPGSSDENDRIEEFATKLDVEDFDPQEDLQQIEENYKDAKDIIQKIKLANRLILHYFRDKKKLTELINELIGGEMNGISTEIIPGIDKYYPVWNEILRI